jgi:SWI/SNF-related matrix-associated actin-dependent regulator of chromatin subfamily A-like protein 1
MSARINREWATLDHLYNYQKAGAEFLAARRAAILGDSMGLGKTVQAIAACDAIAAERITIICPAIARENWRREFIRWQRQPRAVHIINKGADVRHLAAPVQITSYALASTPAVREGLRRRGNDVLILDEAQALKDPNSVRTQSVYSPRGLITSTRRVWALTGTLCPNAAHEAWTHVKSMRRTSLTYGQWIRRYCSTKDTPYGTAITGTNMLHAGELADILRPLVLQRTATQVALDLPELRWGQVMVRPDNVPPAPETTEEVRAILHRLEAGDDITAAEKLCLASLRRWTELAKAPALIELLRSDLETTVKIVLFGIHREALRQIADAFGDDAAELNGDTSIAERQQIIDQFQTSSRPRLLVCQMQVASTALNLHAAHNVVFSAVTWTPLDVVQAAARCHRIGQTQPVLARVISLAGSIDEAMAAVTLRKATELAHLNTLINRKSA